MSQSPNAHTHMRVYYWRLVKFEDTSLKTKKKKTSRTQRKLRTSQSSYLETCLPPWQSCIVNIRKFYFFLTCAKVHTAHNALRCDVHPSTTSSDLSPARVGDRGGARGRDEFRKARVREMHRTDRWPLIRHHRFGQLSLRGYYSTGTTTGVGDLTPAIVLSADDDKIWRREDVRRISAPKNSQIVPIANRPLECTFMAESDLSCFISFRISSASGAFNSYTIYAINYLYF